METAEVDRKWPSRNPTARSSSVFIRNSVPHKLVAVGDEDAVESLRDGPVCSEGDLGNFGKVWGSIPKKIFCSSFGFRITCTLRTFSR